MYDTSITEMDIDYAKLVKENGSFDGAYAYIMGMDSSGKNVISINSPFDAQTRALLSMGAIGPLFTIIARKCKAANAHHIVIFLDAYMESLDNKEFDPAKYAKRDLGTRFEAGDPSVYESISITKVTPLKDEIIAAALPYVVSHFGIEWRDIQHYSSSRGMQMGGNITEAIHKVYTEEV